MHGDEQPRLLPDEPQFLHGVHLLIGLHSIHFLIDLHSVHFLIDPRIDV